MTGGPVRSLDRATDDQAVDRVCARVVVLRVPVTGHAVVHAVSGVAAPGSSRWRLRWVDTVDGQPLAWHGDSRRVGASPVNAAAWALAARLGCPDLAERIGFHGDLLLAGVTTDGWPSDVPVPVIEAARRAGLFTPLAPSRTAVRADEARGTRADRA